MFFGSVSLQAEVFIHKLNINISLIFSVLALFLYNGIFLSRVEQNLKSQCVQVVVCPFGLSNWRSRAVVFSPDCALETLGGAFKKQYWCLVFTSNQLNQNLQGWSQDLLFKAPLLILMHSQSWELLVNWYCLVFYL